MIFFVWQDEEIMSNPCLYVDLCITGSADDEDGYGALGA